MLIFVSSRRLGNNPIHLSDVSAVRPESNVHSARARQMMHMFFETCAREELNKLELYVDAA